MDRDVRVLTFLVAVLVLIAATLRTRGAQRAAIWYGDLMVRTVTFGACSADDVRPVMRVLIGALGILGLAAWVVSVVSLLASR